MNRKIARERLKDKLDLHFNGENSKLAQKWEKIRRRKKKSNYRLEKGRKSDATQEFENDCSSDSNEK